MAIIAQSDIHVTCFVSKSCTCARRPDAEQSSALQGNIVSLLLRPMTKYAKFDQNAFTRVICCLEIPKDFAMERLLGNKRTALYMAMLLSSKSIWVKQQLDKLEKSSNDLPLNKLPDTKLLNDCIKIISDYEGEKLPFVIVTEAIGCSASIHDIKKSLIWVHESIIDEYKILGILYLGISNFDIKPNTSFAKIATKYNGIRPVFIAYDEDLPYDDVDMQFVKFDQILQLEISGDMFE